MATLLRQEFALFVLSRLAFRLSIVVSPLAGWGHPGEARVLALVQLLTYDAPLARSLHRGGRPRLRVRWLLDVLDVTAWALATAPLQPYSGTMDLAGPALMGTTIRRGPLLAAVAAICLVTITSSARMAIGALPFTRDALLYAGMWVALGSLLTALLRVEVARQREFATALDQADLAAATLAGRNDVITGARADMIDELQTSIMQLTAAGVDAATALRAAVARHKQVLGQETRVGAVYLRDALDVYAARLRADEPAVSRYVFFNVPGDTGVCVLSQRQCDQLHAVLAASRLTGTVPVRVISNRPQGPLAIQVGQTIFELATPPAKVRLTLVPVAAAALALFVLKLSDAVVAPVPLTLTVPVAGIILAYAIFSLLWLRRASDRAEPWLALGILAPFIVAALLAASPATTGDVQRRVGGAGLLVGLAIVLGTVVRPRAAAVLAPWALVLATVVVVRTSGQGLPIGRIASDLVWMPVAFLGARLTTRAIAQLSSELSGTFEQDRADRAAVARGLAATQEIVYLLDVLSQGEALADGAEPGPIRAGVRRDLARLRQRLLAQLERITVCN